LEITLSESVLHLVWAVKIGWLVVGVRLLALARFLRLVGLVITLLIFALLSLLNRESEFGLGTRDVDGEANVGRLLCWTTTGETNGWDLGHAVGVAIRASKELAGLVYKAQQTGFVLVGSILATWHL
jgi:hypothetical protein